MGSRIPTCGAYHHAYSLLITQLQRIPRYFKLLEGLGLDRILQRLLIVCNCIVSVSIAVPQIHHNPMGLSSSKACTNCTKCPVFRGTMPHFQTPQVFLSTRFSRPGDQGQPQRHGNEATISESLGSGSTFLLKVANHANSA